jgi:pectate lyase
MGGAGGGGITGTAGATGRGGATGTGGAACAGYAFCDDFEDGDTVGWAPNGGTWSVVTDGSRVYQGGNGNAFSVAGQPTWTDQTITARVKITQWGGTSTSYRAGIVARATDASNQYVFAIDASGALRLLKGTSAPSGTGATGTCGKVSPTPLATAGTWYTMQMKIVGTGNNVSLTTSFNGTPIHDCQTTVGTLPAGAAGTYIYGPNTIAAFDDVRISTP